MNSDKNYFKRILKVLTFFIIILFCIYVFYLPYHEIKLEAIKSLNSEQMVLAKQAAKGIQSFFEHYTYELDYMSRSADVILMNSKGRARIEDFYKSHKREIRAITRVSPEGKIIWTIPYNKKSMGADVSFQAHNRYIMKKHMPIVSDVFRAVQGYETVAYAYPVFKDGKYAGSISILIPFDLLADKFLSGIQVRKRGYAWMLSRGGIELYCPVKGHTGKTIYETSGESPSVIAMAKKMMEGKEGVTTYIYNFVRNKRVYRIKKHAVYFPVILSNSFWSIAVATPESDVLAVMESFRNKWLLIMFFFSMGIIAYFYYFIRARAVLREEKKRIKAEKALQKTEEQYRLLVERMNDGLAMEDKNGILAYVNPRFCSMLGYEREEMIGKPTESFLDDKNRSILKKQMVLRRENNNEGYEIEWVNKDGTGLLTYISPQSLFNESGEFNGSFAVIADITERKKTQEFIIQTEKMMTVGSLAAGMAHEINNPLAIILQGVNAACSRLSPENEKNRAIAEKLGININSIIAYLEERNIIKYLDGIQEAGKRASEIVANMLKFSRRSSYLFEYSDLNAIIEKSIEIASKDYDFPKQYDFRNIKISTDYDKELPKIYCVETEIQQVILNLLKNSAQAILSMGEIDFEPEIRIATFREGDFAVTMVYDNGPGMNEGTIKRIFEPFYTTKDVGAGTGLGLSISYYIVTSHHKGIITAESKQGEGAAFIIKLPFHSEK